VALSGDSERVIVGGEAPVVLSWERGQWVSQWRKPSSHFGTHVVYSLTPNPSAFTFVAAGTSVEDPRRGDYRGFVMVSPRERRPRRATRPRSPPFPLHPRAASS
jgi:hypothetical protein